MKERRLVLCVVLIGVFASACVVDEATMVVVGNVVGEGSKASCEWEATEEGPFYTSGSMDLAFASSYTMTPVIKNQMPPSSSVEITPGSKEALNNSLIEGNTIVLEGAEISLTPPANTGLVLPQSVFTPISGTVPPNSLFVLRLPVITEPTALQLATNPVLASRGAAIEILANVKLLGKTVAGREVESLEFSYPIRLCVGCLIDPTECANEELPADDDYPCVLGQDEFVDCRICEAYYRPPDPMCQ